VTIVLRLGCSLNSRQAVITALREQPVGWLVASAASLSFAKLDKKKGEESPN